MTRFGFLMNSTNDDLFTAYTNLSELYEEISAERLFYEIRSFRELKKFERPTKPF